MGQQVDKAKRRAAGHTCIALFHMQSSVCSILIQALDPPVSGLREGITDKEWEHFRKLVRRLNSDADHLRAFGHRLLGKS